MNRDVFKYTLDGKIRYADPLASWGTLTVLLGGDPYSVAERARGNEAAPNVVDEAMALSQIQNAVMQAFGLPAFDPETGGGATLKECLEIWEGLIGFMADAKKKRDS